MTRKFNLKKMADSKDIVPIEKQIINKNKELNTESIDNSGNYDYRLRDGRKDPRGDVAYEKMLSDVRVAKENTGITEAEMNKEDHKPINGMEMRSDKMNKTPLMDYSIENDNKLAEQISKETKKDKRDTSFWDDGVGEQMLGEKTVIVSNKPSSQLLSNYKTREDFEKANKMIRTAMSTMKDADALLYSIFRKAADERRELKDVEKQIVLDINSGKIRALSQINLEDPKVLDQKVEYKKNQIGVDTLEEKEMIDQAIEKAMSEI